MDFDDAQLVRFVRRLQGREGVHARMWHDRRRGTGYSPVHQPLDESVARRHLEGVQTVGAYVVRQDQTCGFGVVDLDATRPAMADAQRDRHAAHALQHATHEGAMALRDALRARGLHPLLLDSGYKGRHLWVFFAQGVPAARVRAVLHGAVADVALDRRVRAECFPKQDRVARGKLGNLVKLPLGVHLRTGRRATVLDEAGQPHPSPLGALLSHPDSPPPVAVAASDAPATVDPEEDTGPALAPQLLAACPLLRYTVDRVRRDRQVKHDELVVLNHSIGHLPDGVLLLNDLYERIPDLPEAAMLGAPHRGNPVSCAKARKRLPEHARQVPCACTFPERSGAYAHPLRHLDDTVALEGLLAQLAEARKQARQVEREVADQLRQLPEQRASVAAGAWVLGPDDRVRFVPQGA